jgi:hypothetical protein
VTENALPSVSTCPPVVTVSVRGPSSASGLTIAPTVRAVALVGWMAPHCDAGAEIHSRRLIPRGRLAQDRQRQGGLLLAALPGSTTG